MPFTNRKISETGAASGVQVGDEKCIKDYGLKTLRKVTTWNHCIQMERRCKIDLKEWMGDCGLHIAGSDTDKWRAFADKSKNLRVPHNAGNFLTS
jgi:hypothetical protein